MSSEKSRDSPAVSCLIRAGLEAQIIFPTDPEYESIEQSYWSNTAKLGPACIVRPTTPEQVSAAVKALVAANEKFAVRSGGHSQVAGSNNIAGGVTIDLSLLTSIRYDDRFETVTFGPGLRWKHVYQELQKYDRVVAGGRESSTGVAGLIVGGGNSFHTARTGFACDNVVSFEVVLADGQVVTASRDARSDLFRALKGGSNNFGIVVSFTMSTIAGHRIWGGTTTTPKEYMPDVIQAIVNFTKNLPNNPDCSLIPVICHLPQATDISVLMGLTETKGVENPPAFAECARLPKTNDTTAFKTTLEMVSEFAHPGNHYNTWFTLTLKNDPGILMKATEEHEQLVKALNSYIPDGDFITECILQPIPTIFAQRSVAAGGNVLGLERNKCDGILLSMNTMVKTLEQKNFAYPRVKAATEAIKQYASTVEGGLLDWLYLNYADQSQDVLAGYGAENIEFLKGVSAKYDPEAVFQKLCPGGFKLRN